jgi:hypothetical protein
MKLEEACYSLKLECALRDLGFVDIGWKCVAHAGIYFVQPVGIPDDPDADLLGFSLSKNRRCYKLVSTAKRALDIAQGL